MMLLTQIVYLGQIEVVEKVVDHATAASDRGLFLYALAIIIIGGGAAAGAAIRWLVTGLKEKDKLFAESMRTKDDMHAAERNHLYAEIKSEHIECRVARKEDQAAFLHTLEVKDKLREAQTIAIETLTHSINNHFTASRHQQP